MTQVDLPSGTVTFLFTDIEGSTRLLQELGQRYSDVLAAHRALIEDAASARSGRVFGTEGDAVFLAFPDASSAVVAAADAQRALAAHTWPDGRSLLVRMGIHTGDATVVGGDYVGLSLHQAARITAAGHGGQVLVSGTTAQLMRNALPDGHGLRDLGEHRLKDLAGRERLFQLVGPGLTEAFPALRTLEGRPNNLPVQVTSFVGREELAETRRLLASTRLLTLTGPGGTGKTRLALQLAGEMSDDFPDGVFFVALDTVRESELIPSEIVRALGLMVPGGRSPQEHVIDHVRSRRLLLVLDNFEQILDGAPFVAQLLREAQDLKVVVTSRIPLRIYGEQEFPVPALGVPPRDAATVDEVAAHEAARLFVERAMAAKPAFRMTPDNASAVADIVRRLDGLPLAIELAASRMRIFPIEALRSRLGERLAVLTGGPRDLPDRQKTLRGAIDWSHDLLDEPDRHLFARLSVFAGGAFLPDVESVCGPASEIGREVVEGVDSLVENSLVRTDPRAVEEPRIGMLATIQEYAVERLEERGEEGAERRRHAMAFLSLVESYAGRLTGPEARPLLDRLEVDHDNLRAALDWAVENGEVEIAMRFIAATWRFWQIRGHLTEAHTRIERVLALQNVGEQRLTLQARALGAAGSIGYWRADYVTAHTRYKAALEAARATGDDKTIADALYDFSFATEEEISMEEDRFRFGRPHLEQSLTIYRRLGDEEGIAKTTWALAIAAFTEDDFETGLRTVGESIESYQHIGDAFGLGWALHLRSMAQISTGRLDGARADMGRALRIFVSSDDQTGIMGTLLDRSMLAAAQGDIVRQWRLRGAVERLRKATGTELLFTEIPSLSWTVPDLPADDPDAVRAWREGEEMSTDEAVAMALEPEAL